MQKGWISARGHRDGGVEDFSRRSGPQRDSCNDASLITSLHAGVAGSNLICQHLVSRPIQDLISTAPLVLTARRINAKHISVSCLEEASVLDHQAYLQ